MDERLRNWLPSIALLAIALAGGVGWRAELECRGGWAGLAWLGYFHWSVPIFVGAFVLWAAVFASVKNRVAFVVTLTAFSVGAYFITDIALRFFFGGGPSAMITVFNLGGGDFHSGFRRFRILHLAAPVVWPVIPFLFCLLCRLFGAPITISRALCSAVLFTISWPLAVFFRAIFEQRGGSDLIHALKSGFVVPFLIVSLGIPLLHFRLQLSHLRLRM
jgi:hypothetical protein